MYNYQKIHTVMHAGLLYAGADVAEAGAHPAVVACADVVAQAGVNPIAEARERARAEQAATREAGIKAAIDAATKRDMLVVAQYRRGDDDLKNKHSIQDYTSKRLHEKENASEILAKGILAESQRWVYPFTFLCILFVDLRFVYYLSKRAYQVISTRSGAGSHDYNPDHHY